MASDSVRQWALQNGINDETLRQLNREDIDELEIIEHFLKELKKGTERAKTIEVTTGQGIELRHASLPGVCRNEMQILTLDDFGKHGKLKQRTIQKLKHNGLWDLQILKFFDKKNIQTLNLSVGQQLALEFSALPLTKCYSCQAPVPDKGNFTDWMKKHGVSDKSIDQLKQRRIFEKRALYCVYHYCRDGIKDLEMTMGQEIALFQIALPSLKDNSEKRIIENIEDLVDSEIIDDSSKSTLRLHSLCNIKILQHCATEDIKNLEISLEQKASILIALEHVPKLTVWERMKNFLFRFQKIKTIDCLKEIAGLDDSAEQKLIAEDMWDLKVLKKCSPDDIANLNLTLGQRISLTQIALPILHQQTVVEKLGFAGKWVLKTLWRNLYNYTVGILSYLPYLLMKLALWLLKKVIQYCLNDKWRDEALYLVKKLEEYL